VVIIQEMFLLESQCKSKLNYDHEIIYSTHTLRYTWVWV